MSEMFRVKILQSVLPKGRPFTANSGTKNAVLSKGRSSTANSGTKAAVLLGMNRCGSCPWLSAPHSIFSIWTDLKKIWKVPRGLNLEMRRMDIANWVFRISPKYTTGVKYQFQKGFHQITDPEIPVTLRPPPNIDLWSCNQSILRYGAFCPMAGPSLQAQEHRLQFCRKQLFHRTLMNQGCSFTRDWIDAVASRCFPHPILFSIWIDLKRYEKFPGVPSNWMLMFMPLQFWPKTIVRLYSSSESPS